MYLPKGAGDKPPVVIMGHGIGAQKDMSLPKYAEKFASNGIAVFAFDYRNFGGSDGLPRHWVSPKRHLQDWMSSFAFVKSTGVGGKIDPNRIALWGTSFAGGHVLVTASKLGSNVSAVVSQMPHLDGTLATKKRIATQGLLQPLRLVAAGLHDALRSRLGLGPAWIKLIGGKDELAIMQVDAHELQTYFSRHPTTRQGGWRPMVLGRVMLELSKYNPINHLDTVQAPVMLVAADKDQLCPPALVKEAAKKLGDKATLVRHNCTHFEIYRGNFVEAVSEQMLDFLTQHLMPGASRRVAADTSMASAASASSGAIDAPGEGVVGGGDGGAGETASQAAA